MAIHRYDDEDWSRLAHIIIQGEADILTDGETHRKAIRLLRRKYPQYRSHGSGRTAHDSDPGGAVHPLGQDLSAGAAKTTRYTFFTTMTCNPLN